MSIPQLLLKVESAPARIRVVLTNLLTLLTAANAVVVYVVAQVDLPIVAEYGSIALSVISTATVFIRRVTPVEADERGLI